MLKNLLLCMLFVFGVGVIESKTIILTDNNFVSLLGPVTKSSVDDVIHSFSSRNIYEYMLENKQINLYINSPGGSVFAGAHLVQYIQSLQESGIVVNCIGQNFMSMAFIIMQSCSNRYGMFDSLGMQHQMSLGLRGSIENFRSYFNMIDRVNLILSKMEMHRMSMTQEEYFNKILSDWWSYGEENVKNKIVDEIVTVRCASSIMTDKIKKNMSLFEIDFIIEQYRCPLINDVRVNMRNISKYYDSDNYALNVKELINKFNGEKN